MRRFRMGEQRVGPGSAWLVRPRRNGVVESETLEARPIQSDHREIAATTQNTYRTRLDLRFSDHLAPRIAQQGFNQRAREIQSDIENAEGS